jgi:hypothetical protein
MTDWKCDGCGLTRLQSLTFPTLCCVCVAEATIDSKPESVERQLEEVDLTPSILDSGHNPAYEGPMGVFFEDFEGYHHFAPEDFTS